MSLGGSWEGFAERADIELVMGGLCRKGLSWSEFSRRSESRRVFPRGRKPGEAFRIRSFLDELSSLGESRWSTFQEVGIREGFPTRPDSGRGSDREPESR